MSKERNKKSAKNNNRFGKRRNRNQKPNRSKKRNGKASALENHLFIKKAIPVTQKEHVPEVRVDDLPVDTRIISNLKHKGFEYLTEIQEKTIDPLMANRDLMGLAQTGTGKTAAFLVPLANKLLNTKASYQVLVVIPTRELAMQIQGEMKSIMRNLGLTSQVFIGGTNVKADINKLRKPSHFIIGTPGRLLDMADRGALKFSKFKTLVLDEFDRLLDMGFSRDIQKMVAGMKQRKQTILFSATEEASQKKLIEKLLTNPVEVRVHQKNSTGDHIDQEIIKLKEGENKMDVLTELINQPSFEKVIVFAETKRWVSKVCKQLKNRGIKTDEIHGDKSQNYRQKALNKFKAEKIQVLVATDVAARGIDIKEVSHVINYQKPKSFDSYIHRIGRTGRAGKSGKALTFVN